MIRNGLEPWHVIVLLVVVLLVFGGKKLPELARGSGRALRIFKAETKGLMDDDDDEPKPTWNPTSQAQTQAAPPPAVQPAPQAAPQADAPQSEIARHDTGTD